MKAGSLAVPGADAASLTRPRAAPDRPTAVDRPLENPTLIERIVSLIPLPYPIAAFLWASLLIGPVGIILVQLVVTGRTTSTLAGIANAILNIVLSWYLYLIVRYIRLRVLAMEPPIASRLDGGEEAYHRTFGIMTRTWPAVLLAAATGTLLLGLYAYSGTLSKDASLLVFNVLLVYMDSFAFGTFIWEFASASWGLYVLGRSSLRLASFEEDRMVGVRPLGNLALSLTVAYFGSLLLSGLVLASFLPTTIPSTIMLLILLAAGVALFFLPLTSIHARMRDEKRRILRTIGARYPRLEADPPAGGGPATLDDVQRGVKRLTDLQELELLDRKASSLPTWPFDIQVVSRFVTIVLSVTAVLVGRLITDLLHI